MIEAPGVGRRFPPFCGRDLSSEDQQVLCEIVDSCGISRHELAATICEALGWTRPNGRLKRREAYEYLGLLEARGLLKLPPKQGQGPRGCTSITLTEASAPRPVRECTLAEVQPVRLALVSTAEERALWRELVERHHYLGHRVPYGAHLRYLVWLSRPAREVAGCIQFSSAARRLQVRDRWIGWDEETRARLLSHVVCNSRFLILPWWRVAGMASHILGLGARVMPDDWQEAYAVRPVLLETFVRQDRFDGTCYRAANWTDLGETAGRGRMDRDHQGGETVKTCLVYPLVGDFRRRLGVER